MPERQVGSIDADLPDHHGKVDEREIASVVWHQRGHDMEVIYVEGDAEHLVGSEAITAGLAANAGLSIMPTTDGTVRWVRDPSSRHVA